MRENHAGAGGPVGSVRGVGEADRTGSGKSSRPGAHDPTRMRIPQNVGEVDHNVRMFLALPALVLAVTSAMAYHAYAFSAVAVLVGAAFLTTGALRYSPAYHLLDLDTRFDQGPF